VRPGTASLRAGVLRELTNAFAGVHAYARVRAFALVSSDWDTTKAQSTDSLNFQDNWDEDATDKDFIAQLRKELGK
jgi:hypothetical protein